MDEANLVAKHLANEPKPRWVRIEVSRQVVLRKFVGQDLESCVDPRPALARLLLRHALPDEQQHEMAFHARIEPTSQVGLIGDDDPMLLDEIEGGLIYCACEVSLTSVAGLSPF
jgi:hypothetical protein